MSPSAARCNRWLGITSAWAIPEVQEGRQAFEKRLAYPGNREGVVDHFPDPSIRKSVEVDVALIDQYDALVIDLELTIVREAKRHDGDAFHRLRSPGIGKVLALTILYEIHDITRFDRVQEFASYARLIKGTTIPSRTSSLHRAFACCRWGRFSLLATTSSSRPPGCSFSRSRMGLPVDMVRAIHSA